MRGIYIILFGILGFSLLGCIGIPESGEEEQDTVITTTDDECPGCAPVEEETTEEEDEEEAPPEEPAPVENETEEEPDEVPEEEGLTLEEAREIALNSSCIDEGNLTDNYIYNEVTNTWWFDMDIVKEGCAPACVVDEETGTAEINWRCTGLIVPENETEQENETGETDPYENATGCVGPTDTNYDIFKKEEVWYNGMIYEDTCTLATIVKDFYCKDGKVSNIATECPADYDCRNGECKPVEYTCSKSFGNDTTVKGHIIVAKGLNTVVDEYDECLDDGMIKEWVCTPDGHAEALELYCGSGMRCADGEGRCVRSNCVETDDGDDPEHFGKITFKNKDDEYSDTCTEDDKLREYYCYGDGIRSKNYRCSDECFYDECTPVEE